MWIALYKNNCSTFFIDKPLACIKNPSTHIYGYRDFIKAYEYLKAHLSARTISKLH
jgi:hypothetical protein